MISTVNTVIALPYEAARLPLKLIDQGLVGRLPETSAPRLTLDRTIGSVDKLAGAVLRNSDIAERGTGRLERADKLRTAARLERKAATRRQQAQETAAAGSKEASAKRQAAQKRAAEGLDEAEAVEQRGKKQAKTQAATTAAKKKAAAAERAESRNEVAEQRKKRTETAAEAKKRTTQRKAKAELDDARETKKDAVEARADAERLEDLTEAKKKARTQG